MTGWKAYLGAAILVIDALSAILHQLVGTPTLSPEMRNGLATLGTGLGVAGIRHKQERTGGADPAQKKSVISRAAKAVTLAG